MKHRLQQAKAAFYPSVRRLFTTSQMSVSVRLMLFDVLVMSRLLYGVESWHRFPRTALHQLEVFQMTAVRRITGQSRVPREGHAVLSDVELRKKYHVESLENRARRCRIKHAAA